MQDLTWNIFRFIGMRACLFGPHHFQANDRYWNDRLARELKWGEFENYGLKSFEFNKEALKNSMVEITNLEARFRDGSIVRYGQTRRA